MDPNANLAEQRKIIARMREHIQRVACACTRCDEDAQRLLELTEALDRWLVDGGFLPKEWKAR